MALQYSLLIKQQPSLTPKHERPFQSNGGCGKLISIDAVNPGNGAIAVGGSSYSANMSVALQRASHAKWF